MLAAGDSYAATSKWALRVSGTADRRVRKVINEDGNPIPAGRHYPTKPRRTRPMRFIDAGPTAGPNAEQAAT